MTVDLSKIIPLVKKSFYNAYFLDIFFTFLYNLSPSEILLRSLKNYKVQI